MGGGLAKLFVEVQRIELALFELTLYGMELVKTVLSELLVVVLVVRSKNFEQAGTAHAPLVYKAPRPP